MASLDLQKLFAASSTGNLRVSALKDFGFDPASLLLQGFIAISEEGTICFLTATGKTAAPAQASDTTLQVKVIP